MLEAVPMSDRILQPNYRGTASDYETHVRRSVSEIDVADWNTFVERVSGSTVFHRAEWIRAVERGIGHTPRHIEVRKDGNLIAILPQFCMPFPKGPFHQLRSSYPGFGGPVIGTDHAAALDALLTRTRGLCGGRTVLHEIRVCEPAYLRYHDRLRNTGYHPARYKGRFVLDLDASWEELRAEMSRSRQRGIDRGEAIPHEVQAVPPTRRHLSRFYNAYVEHLESVDGSPYPFAFFEELAAMEEQLLLLELWIEGEHAGGFLELLDEHHGTIRGFFFAIPPRYRDVHAPELMYAHVIRWGIEQGYERYDFGGASGDFANGNFRFKKGFGGRLVPNLYWERGFGPGWMVTKTGRSLYFRGRSALDGTSR